MDYLWTGGGYNYDSPVRSGNDSATEEKQRPNDGGGTFRLHTDAEPASRLDPALELKRNLTNWGLTYKVGFTLKLQDLKAKAFYSGGIKHARILTDFVKKLVGNMTDNFRKSLNCCF